VLIRIPRLDRRVGYRLTVLARSGHPQPQSVTVEVERARPGAPATIGIAPTKLEIPLPPSPRSSVFVTLTPSITRAPDDRDSRTLGFVIEGLALSPDAGAFPFPGSAAIGVAITTAAYGAAAALAGCPLGVVAATAVAAAGTQTWLVGHDAALLGTYPDVFTPLAGLAIAGGALIALIRRLGGWTSGGTIAAALLMVLVVTALRIAVVYHPSAPIGDSMFQVHRAGEAIGGHYFLTSVTPPPYFKFPYAVGLFLAAQPFWQGTKDHVALLRTLVLAADALAAVLVLVVSLRVWRSHATAFAATLFYLSAPVGIQTLATGNLSNGFAQSVFTAGLLCGVVACRSRRPWAWGLGAAALMAGGVLSHFGTLLIGPGLLVGVWAAWFAGARGEDRRGRRWAPVALLLALAVAYGLFYRHYDEVFRETVTRILSGERPQRSMVPTVTQEGGRAMTFLRFAHWNYTWILLAPAMAGCAWLARRGARDPLSLALWGGLAASAAYAGIAIATPLEVRVTLAAQPIVALAAASAAGAALDSPSRWMRWAGAACCLAAAWVGAATLVEVLGQVPPMAE
jgi:hypothetical protein